MYPLYLAVRQIFYTFGGIEALAAVLTLSATPVRFVRTRVSTDDVTPVALTAWTLKLRRQLALRLWRVPALRVVGL